VTKNKLKEPLNEIIIIFSYENVNKYTDGINYNDDKILFAIVIS
jgi:hypothetical protein